MADRSWGSELGYKKDQDHQLLLMHWSHRSSHMWERCLCIRNKWYTFIHRTKCGNHKNRHQNPQMNENSHMGKEVLKGASLITKPKTTPSGQATFLLWETKITYLEREVEGHLWSHLSRKVNFPWNLWWFFFLLDEINIGLAKNLFGFFSNQPNICFLML